MHFHAAGQAAAGKGELSSPTARQPLSRPDLQQRVDIGGHLGPLYSFFPFSEGALERGVAWIDKHGSRMGWDACAPKGWEGYKEVQN